MTSSQLDRKQLIEDGQDLVYSLAARIHRKIPVRVEFDDLVAYGEIGLSQAARDFDPEFGTQFTTFAYYRIQGAIYDGISKMSWGSRAAYRRARFQQMANEVLSDEGGANASRSTESLQEGAQWFRDVTGKLAVVYFASQVENVDGVFEDVEETASSAAARREVNDRLIKLVDELPNQARTLIRTIYFEGATLQEAANRMGSASRGRAESTRKYLSNSPNHCVRSAPQISRWRFNQINRTRPPLEGTKRPKQEKAWKHIEIETSKLK